MGDAINPWWPTWECGDDVGTLPVTTTPLRADPEPPALPRFVHRPGDPHPYGLRLTNTGDGVIAGSTRPMAWVLRDGRVVGGGVDPQLYSRQVSLAPGESADLRYFLRPGPLLSAGRYDVYLGGIVGRHYGLAGPFPMTI